MIRHHLTVPALAQALCLTLVVLTGAGTADARDPLPNKTNPRDGRELIRILFDGPPGIDLDRVREVVRTREGDLYRSAAVRKDIAALTALGSFAEVSTTTAALRDGLILTFHLRANRKIAAIRFEGNVKLKKKDLLETLHSKVGDSAGPYKLNLDLQTLRSEYRDSGYLFASVHQKTRETPDGTEIIYRIEAGARLRIESVQFEGNTAISDRALRKQMISVRPANILTRREGEYDPLLLRSDLTAIRERFRRMGYLNATVGHELIFEDTKERAYLIIRVREGPQFQVARITIHGANLFKPSELAAAMKLRENGPFSPNQLSEDIETIRKMYGRHGYVKAGITHGWKPMGDKPRVTLDIRIEEGPICYVNRIIIRGNYRTKDHVIRRAIHVLPGERINTDALDESKRRLINTGLFFSPEPQPDVKPVRIRYLDTGNPAEVDVVVEVTEGNLGQMTVGASWNSATGLVGNFTVSLLNFDALDVPESWRDLCKGSAWTGGGQKLSLSLSPGTYYRDYRLSWLNPSVWDSPYHTGFDVYIQDYIWPHYYDSRRTGGVLHFGRRFFHDLRVSLSPSIERVDIHDIHGNAPADAAAARGTHDRLALVLSVAYDKRDNIFLPTRGYRLASQIEMAGTCLGGDVDFLRESFEAQKWWTLWDQVGWGRHVVNAGLRGGLMQSTSGDRVPIFERFFIGGAGSLRGFRPRRVGPIEPATRRQTGGKYQAILSAEYNAPLIRDVVRAVAFVDMGALEWSLSDFDGDSFRASTGLSVQFRFPQLGMQEVPIVFCLATPVRKTSSDRKEIFSFSIGTGFAF